MLHSCSLSGKKKVEAEVEYPDVIQYNYTHYVYKNGRIFLEAYIDKGETFEVRKEIDCTGISALVYNSKNELTTKITSLTGVINSKTSQLIFSDNVVVDKYDDKITLKTDNLKLNYKDNMMESPGKVIITKEDGSELQSNSFVSNLNDQTTTFTSMDMKYYYEDEEDTKK